MEHVIHTPDECSVSIHISLYHNLAGKAVKESLDCIVLSVLRVHSGLGIGITEVYLAVESSFGYYI